MEGWIEGWGIYHGGRQFGGAAQGWRSKEWKAEQVHFVFHRPNCSEISLGWFLYLRHQFECYIHLILSLCCAFAQPLLCSNHALITQFLHYDDRNFRQNPTLLQNYSRICN